MISLRSKKERQCVKNVVLKEWSIGRLIRSPYALLALICVLCHGVLLLCDYKIWDGWLIANWQQNSRFDVMRTQYYPAGIQHHYFIHRLFGLFPHRIWLYKLASLLAYYGTACAFYHLTVVTKFLDRGEAILASVFMMSFPGMMTLGEAAVFPYVLGLFLFFSAACLAVHSELMRARPDWLRGCCPLYYFCSVLHTSRCSYSISHFIFFTYGFSNANTQFNPFGKWR